MTASIYALALGSNIGAVSFTFSASLAGLLWKRILAQKGIQIGALQFARRSVWFFRFFLFPCFLFLTRGNGEDRVVGYMTDLQVAISLHL